MAREHTIGIRLDDDELAALRDRAVKERRRPSDLARLLILDGLDARQKPQPSPPVAAPSTRTERAARRDDGHAFAPGANQLKCKVCGVPQIRHP